MGGNIILNEIRASPRGRVTWYPDKAAATVQPANPTFARRSYLILGCTNRDNSPFDLS